MATVAELDILFNANADQARGVFGMVQDDLFRTALAAGGMGGALLGGYTAALDGAIDLETEMRNVNSIAQVSDATLADWTDRIQTMGIEVGESSITMAKGMYQIQSAGFSAADSLDILEVSSKAARAGLTTTEVAADAVTSVLNSYQNNLDATSSAYQALNSEGERAEYIQNVLFRTVDRGKLTYEELAGSVGRVTAVAAQAGLPIEDIGAAIAVMTQQGLSGDEAVTALYNSINAFIKPADAMTAAVTELGYETPLAMLQTLGLAGAMQVLEDYTGGSADEVAKLFTNIRGQRGAVLMMSGDMEAMTAAMYDAQSSTGKLSAMELALEQQTQSTSFYIDVFKAALEVMGQEITQGVLPAIRFFLGMFVDLIKGFVGLPDPIKDFIGLVIAISGALFSAAGAVAIFVALFGPILGLLASLSAAILAVTIPLAALGVAFQQFGFRDTIQGFSDIVDALDVPFLDHFTNSVERAAEAYQRFTGLFQTDTGFTQVDGLAKDIGALGAALIAFADSTSGIDFLDGALGDFGQFLKDISPALDTFLKAYELYKSMGTQESAPGAGGSSFYGGKDTGEGKFQRLYSNLEAFRFAWMDFADSMRSTFPGQVELIGQLDDAMMGLFDTIKFAELGEWSLAWDSFKQSMGDFGAVAGTVGRNIANAFQNVDWGAVYDTVGGALDSAFANITQAINWVAYVGVPTVLGWISEHAGDAWDAIKTIVGVGGTWLLERHKETVNWIIDVAVPEVIGYGKYVLGNLKNWLIGQLGGGGAGGMGAGGAAFYGGNAGGLSEMDLGTLIVKWSVDVLEPIFNSVVTDVKGWIIGKMSPGGGVPSPGLGSGNGAGGSGMGSYDIGTVTATWAINVLEPTLAGWISGAASWLQDKLQGYVNGAGGGGGYSEGIGGTRGTAGYGGGGGGLVQLAGWAIDVLDPFVNLSGADIHGAIQKAVQVAGSVGQYTVTGIYLILSQITGEDVSSSSDIPGAIQKFIDNTQKEYNKAVSLTISISTFFGGISIGGGSAPGGMGAGGAAFYGGNAGATGRIQQFFESELFGAGGAEFYQTVKAILNYQVTNLPSDALTKLQAFKDFISKPIDLHIPISLSFDFLNDKLPDLPDWVTDFADAIRPLENFDPTGSVSAFLGIVDGWSGITAAAEEAKIAQQEAVSVAGGAGMPTMTNPDPTSTRPRVAVPGYNPINAENPMNVQGPAPLWEGAFEPPKNMVQSWDQGSGELLKQVQQTGQNVVRQFGADLTPLPQTTYVAAQDTTRQFGVGLQGMGMAVTTEAGNADRNLSTGLIGMAGTAGTQGVATTGALGVGLAGMAPASNVAGAAASSGLGTGIAGMPVAGGAAARFTTGAVGTGLAPLPGVTGSAGQQSGTSFMVGITGGFVEAAIAAQVGASAIAAAANSIGDLYGVGYGVGSSLGAGVAAGIWDQVGAVSAASAALASAAAAGAQARGQISSPSKLMRDEVGIPLAQGIIVGLESQRSNVFRAMDSIVGGSDGSYMVPRSKVVAIINNNNFILEPEAWITTQREAREGYQGIKSLQGQSRLRQRTNTSVTRPR